MTEKYIFCCPLCGGPFEQNGSSLVCGNRHNFDIASDGYVNLLPVQHKNSLSPGDDKEMVGARREFLGSGAYRIFSDALNEIIRDLSDRRPDLLLLDAGCGEGYYTDRLSAEARANGMEWTLGGVDISKAAVRCAAKRNASIQWAVASLFQIPMQAGLADGIFNIFAPIVPDELRRVIKKGGFLVLAVPGEKHLFGLKEILYDSVYANEHIETVYDGFSFADRIPVRGDLELTDPRLMMALLTMTPYYWKTPAAGIERLKQANALKTEIEFDFLIYRAL